MISKLCSTHNDNVHSNTSKIKQDNTYFFFPHILSMDLNDKTLDGFYLSLALI